MRATTASSTHRTNLPSGWSIQSLGNIADITMGNSPPGDSYNDQRIGVPLINGPVEFSEGAFGETIASKFTTAPTKMCRKGDFLICVRGSTTGRTNIAAFDACIGRGVAAIQAHGEQRYVNHFVRTLEKQIYASGNGSTFPSISQQQLHELQVPLPPLPDQKRIADILDKADAIRRKRQEVAKHCNDFLTSAFNTLFGDPVQNPNKWPETTLDAVAHLQSGVTKGRNFGDQQTVEVPYMRVWNVQDGHLRLDDIKDITVLPSDVEKYSLEEGDLLLTEGGDPDQLGRGAIWYAPIPVCIHQNHIFRVRCDQKLIIPEFLSALIGSQKGKRYFLKMAKQTTGIASINMTQLKKCPVFLPPLHLQQQFAKLDRQFEKTCETLNTRFNAVDQLFGSLVQRAFKGEL